MSLVRKQFTPQEKAKIALEALKGNMTQAEIGSRFGVHATQIANWKRQLKEALPEIFGKYSVNLSSVAFGIPAVIPEFSPCWRGTSLQGLYIRDPCSIKMRFSATNIIAKSKLWAWTPDIKSL